MASYDGHDRKPVCRKKIALKSLAKNASIVYNVCRQG